MSTNVARLAVVVLVIAVFTVAFSLARTGTLALPAPRGTGFDSDGYRPAMEWADDELLLVYVGSSGCGWSNVGWLPEVVDSIKRGLQERANAAGYSFGSLGIAVDWSIPDGMRHLAKIGSFDEVAIGNSWQNTSALRYLWQDYPGDASTPQLVLTFRRMLVPIGNGGSRYFALEEETLLQRVVGAGAIRRWLEEGIPLRAPLMRGTDAELW